MKNLKKKADSFLEIYRYLPQDNAYKRRADKVMKELEDHPYFEFFKLKYQDKLTLEQIAEYFDCSYKTICKHKDELLKMIAKRVFVEKYLTRIIDEEVER